MDEWVQWLIPDATLLGHMWERTVANKKGGGAMELVNLLIVIIRLATELILFCGAIRKKKKKS